MSSLILNVLQLLNKPILNFTDSYEMYYVLLPFIHNKIPDWIFKVGLYLPLTLYLSRNLLKVSFDSSMNSQQTDEEQSEWDSKYGDLLND